MSQNVAFVESKRNVFHADINKFVRYLGEH